MAFLRAKRGDFVAASEFKLTTLLSLGAAAVLGLYTFLEEIGVPVTHWAWDESAKEPYNDRWTGAGARV